MFENVAQKYDIMNDAMSLGIHRLWKDKLLHVMCPQPGARLLDVAGGTGMRRFLCPPCDRTNAGLTPRCPQVTSPSVSWTTSVFSRSDRATAQRTRTGPGNPGPWCVTSTRRC